MNEVKLIGGCIGGGLKPDLSWTIQLLQAEVAELQQRVKKLEQAVLDDGK